MRLTLALLLCLSAAQASPALPELYRSVVMDHFLHRNYQPDQFFSELDDGDYKFTDKRGVEKNEIIQPFDFSDNIVASPRIDTMTTFVNLGPPRLPHHQTPFKFSVPEQKSLFAVERDNNAGSVTPTSSPLDVQQQARTAIRPFTFFNIPGPVQQPQQPIQQAVQLPVQQVKLPFQQVELPAQQPVQLPVQQVQMPVQQIQQPVHNAIQQPAQLAVQQPIQRTVPTVQHAAQHAALTDQTVGQQQDLFPAAASRDLNHVNTKEEAFQVLPSTTSEFLPSHNQISQSPIIQHRFQTIQDDVTSNLVQTSVADTDSKPFNIFEYIGRPTSDRGARQKVSPDMMSKMGKMDALKILMKIAGDHWERDLMVGSKDSLGSSTAGEKVEFLCPANSGHFPDSSRCDVYYQCAGGTAHRYSCHSGLQWNIKNNLCDWADSVDCSLNRQFYSAQP